MLESQGQQLSSADGRAAAVQALLNDVSRVRQEAGRLARALEEAGALPDRDAALAERSRVFRDRGLAPDSSVLTQYAVDAAICGTRSQRDLRSKMFARVAVVGPGLDFVDKQEGFDFYAPQSLQPFTLVDSLLRCGLADRKRIQVTTVDISARVNSHLRDAVERATRRGSPYPLVLPSSGAANWLPEAASYWRTAADQIGKRVLVSVPPSLPGVNARRVLVSPDIVRRVNVLESNVVYDRLELSDNTKFDLIVATNVLLYYDIFEQVLSAASLAAALRPGGLLLTNTALLEIPEVPLRSQTQIRVRFSAAPGDGERMIWYRRDEGR